MGVLLRRRDLAAVLAAFILVSAASAANNQPSYWAADASKPSVPTTTSVYKAPRRVLIGPGSWPPACRRRCGKCWPCKAVRVTIHPAVSLPLDYYPEAWRCMCRSKIFMP